MVESISAAEANRQFSDVLRRVKKGRTFVVTSHGRPVARIVPIEERTVESGGSRSLLLQRLRGQRPVQTRRWTRDELYEDES
jgi:prevent-host-death family protein